MSDPDLTPAEEQVRRLLADARLDEPLPDDVADRLDRVLADLQDETAAAARRPGRPRPPAAGAGSPATCSSPRPRSSSSASASAGSTSAARATTTRGAGSADSSAIESAPKSDRRRRERRRRRSPDRRSCCGRRPSTSRCGGLQAVRRTQRPRQQPRAVRRPTGRPGPSGCDDPAWGPGERVPVRYDGQPGVLVLRPPPDATREVDLYLCGDTEITRSVTVPVG